MGRGPLYSQQRQVKERMQADVGKRIIFVEKVEGVLVEESWKGWKFKEKAENLK